MSVDRSVNYLTLNPSDEEVDQARQFILDVLEKTGYKKDKNVHANHVIRDAIHGWDRAPDDFSKRVEMRLGSRKVKVYKEGFEGVFDTSSDFEGRKGFGRPKKTKSDHYQEETLEQIDGLEPIDLLTPSFLTSEEMSYVESRREIYKKEFEFNESSDQVLLQQILVDELIIRRINLARLKGKEVNNKIIDGVMKRFRDNLEKLGVLRVQRIELDTDIQGNVGQLSVELEKKLDKIRKIDDNDTKEEVVRKLNDQNNVLTEDELNQLVEETKFQKQHEIECPENDISSAEVNI